MNRIIVFAIAISLFLASCGGNENQTSKGDVLFDSKKYKEAAEAYTEYLALYPSHTASLYNRGRSYEELKQYDKSLADFNKILELDEKNHNAHLSISKHFYREKNYAKSLIHAKKVIGINGSIANGHLLAARSSHHLGYVKEAMESYNQALSLDNGLGEAYLYRGALFIIQDKQSRACADFKKAVNLEVPEAKEVLSKYCK